MSEPRSCRQVNSGVLVGLLAASFLMAYPQLLNAETLRDVIAKSEQAPNVTSLRNLDRAVLGSSVFTDDRWYVVAYYLDENVSASEAILHIDRLDRRTQKWINAEIPASQRRAGEVDCLGFGIALDSSPIGFLVSTHLSPSAECLLVLTTDLQVRAGLYGWQLAMFRDGSILYHRSQIHFASAHPLEIGLYDIKTGRDTTIFPRKPYQTIRLAEIARLRDFFAANDLWCNVHNHPCDPEWFDNALNGEVAVNEQAALVFVVDYGTDSQDSDAPPVTVGHRKAVYVYRHVRDASAIEYRELSLEEVAGRFGVMNISDLLTDSRLQQIFGN